MPLLHDSDHCLYRCRIRQYSLAHRSTLNTATTTISDVHARADGYTDVGAHSPADDVQDAVYSRTDLGAHDRERVARAVHPAEPAADAPAFLQAHGGAHPAADEPRAFINAVPHADGAAHGDADASSDARTDAGARARADAAADA